MNCNPNQDSLRRRAARAFTLIEMIGVLAVIAILAALLVPKVFNAINDARINSVCINTDTVKTAIVDHYGKYGKFEQLYGTNPAPVVFTSGISAGYDTNILMPESLLDKPYVAKIAGGDPQASSTIEICQGGHENGNSATGYQLDGVTNRTAGAAYVIEAVLQNVAVQDAIDLNNRIDGPSLGAPNATVGDSKGRVEYQAPVAGVVQTLYIYITHR